MRLQALSSTARRSVGAIVGAVVADAACMPLHWNYDLSVLKAKLQSKGEETAPEFYQGSDGCPFYHIPCGKQSCYGDQLYVLLKNVVATKTFDGDSCVKSNYEFFSSAETGYGPWPGPEVNKEDYPVQHGWRHGSIKGFLKNVESGRSFPTAGSTDAQSDAFCKVSPLVALHYARSDGDISDVFLQDVAAAVRTTQNTGLAVAGGLVGARVLHGIVAKDMSPKDAIQACVSQLESSDAMEKTFHTTCGDFSSKEGSVAAIELQDMIQPLEMAMEAAEMGLGHVKAVDQFGKS
jgi:ADP-ribosylglycohydrolase